jgi:DNA-binding beta-propeller fold protein YncE
MKINRSFVASSFIIITLLAGILAGGTAYGMGGGPFGHHGKIVVADRASGTISVINTKTDQVDGTYSLPSGSATPEPMYVAYSPIKKRVFVGDRANNRVVVFDANDFSVETTVDAGAGVFHMWAEVRSKQLWVNNDIDNTTTVIDLFDLSVLATVPTPVDLVAMGGKPHDVIIDPKGKAAYVTVVGVSGANDYVVKYSTSTFQETDRAAVGKDPHVSLNRWNHLLYVPCQNSDAVFILNRKDMNVVKELAVPGAHGAGMSRFGLFFYTTNLPNGGVDALYTIFTLFNIVIGDPVDTPYAVPHNLALIPTGRKLYVTHSGATSDKVTVFTTKGFFDPIPVFSGEVTVGNNPFGLAYVR